jgi:RNA polymerase sigma factor, sigma-70 family
MSSSLDALSPNGLISLCQQADEEAMNLMVQRNLGLVRACIKRFAAFGRDGQELYQQGCLGLVKAIKRFDTRFNVRFSTYAVPVILGELHQFLRDDSPVHMRRRERDQLSKISKAQNLLRQSLGREPTISELAQALRADAAELVLLMDGQPKTFPIEGQTVSDVNAENFVDRLVLKDILSRLPRLEQWLIYFRFEQQLTQTETAKQLHMTQVQVSRLEQKLRTKLLKQLRE